MKYGLMYAYFSRDWEGDYIPAIERIARCGFDVMEIHTPLLLQMADKQLDEIKSCAQHNGITLSYDICLSAETDISSDDTAAQKNGIRYVTDTLKRIHYMGGDNVAGINYVAWNCFDPEIDKQRRTDNSVKCMKEIVKVAEDYGIMYGVEVTNRFEQFMLNTAKEAREYCERVNSDFIGVHLDINHMMIEEDDMYDAILTAGEKLSHFHVAESNRRVAKGGGFLPWNDVARALKAIGYDRIITLEPLVLTGGTIARDAKIWRPLAEDTSMPALEKDICEGLRFIKGLMA